MNKSKWILVAEDDVHLAELTALALAVDELNCEVIITSDGVDALDCLLRRHRFQDFSANNPALVLLDLKMPKLNGLEVLQHIRSDTRLKSIPVVMFTSSREQTDVNLSYQLGANAYVVKPGDFQKFNETLRLLGRFWTAVNELPSEPSTAPVKQNVIGSSPFAVSA